MNYVPFNLKTDYSLLGSLIKMEDFFSFCRANNVSYAAICDNNLSGAIEFYNKCKSMNIKFSLGLEILINDVTLSLYAKNYSGYKNLLKINTLKEKEVLDIESLKNLNENIICVIDYELLDLINIYEVFNEVFIGYKDQFERANALNLSEKVLFNRKIKVFTKDDSVYLKFLNKMGGLNNLAQTYFLEPVNDEKNIEYEKFFSLVDIVFPSSEKYIPKYSQDDENFLYKLAHAGLKKRMGNNLSEKYTDRLNYELGVISSMDFTSYFLIVYDYVLYAKKNNILVGPGRGSAAGSLVCYSIGITDIDPIKYDLLFERFLNPDRVTMPDIDIDFDSEKREEIISYVREKYGNECVAVGSTYNTLKTKLVLREVGKILNIDKELFEKFLKVINRNLSLTDNLKNEKVNKYLKTYDSIAKVYKASLKLENLKKNLSTHAAGVVICSTKLDDLIPVYFSNDVYKTGFEMVHLENLGILKMDFLGLKNLTVISNVLKNVDVQLSDINLDDENVIKMFKDASTDGIFQYETFAMKDLLRKLKPKSFDELIAAVALVRPGPNDFLGEYISNRDNKSNIVYPKNLEPILKETYGIILYQEQIIKILSVVGNFSNSQADNIRRAISKKNEKIISESKEVFLKNASLNGYSFVDAENLFRKIEKFAGYGFNKSHSVAYALIGYQMAYLKTYHEAFFVKEILSGSKDIKFIEGYLNEVKKKNIAVLKPDVNYSKKDFFVINGKLMLPLSLIKLVNIEAENSIIENAPYEDIFDFCIKNKAIKKDVLENLIYAGAMRSFKIDTNTLIQNIEKILNYAALNGQGNKPLLQESEKLSENLLSKYEYSMYGFYISNHPSSKYKNGVMKLNDKNNNLFKNITLIVKVENIKSIKTKKGDDMAFMKVSDETSSDDVVIFSDSYEKIKSINTNDFVKIYGKVNKNQDRTNIVLNSIELINLN